MPLNHSQLTDWQGWERLFVAQASSPACGNQAAAVAAMQARTPALPENSSEAYKHMGKNEVPYAFVDVDQLVADFFADVTRWCNEHSYD